MKKLLKKINVFGLALILIGVLAITTQSSFKSEDLTPYSFNSSTNTWTKVTRSLDQLPGPGGYDPNSYRCDDGSQICTALIDSDESVIDGDTNPETSDESLGIYTPNN